MSKATSITLKYNFVARQQLADFIHQVAAHIDPEWIFDGPLPFLIGSTGTKNAGKSLLWDAFIDATMKRTSWIDPEHSMDLTTNDRIYETWRGTHKKTDRDFSVFLCNYESMFFYIEDDKDIKGRIHDIIDGETARTLGDVVFLSNGGFSEGHLHFDLRFSAGGEWARSLSMQVRGDLANTPSFRDFLKSQSCYER